MSKFMMVKKILLWIWQLPQHLLALLLILVLRSERKGDEYYLNQKSKLNGFSLGDYIFLKTGSATETLSHEKGHSFQSRYLGFLYLPLIGIASAVFCNLWDRLFHKKWSSERRQKWYYSRWPENWADKLGGVKRKL